MRKIVLLSVILTAVYRISLAQPTYFPPSPDVMGLARLANTPINYFSGAPAISVPLGQVGVKDLSVSIGLSYNATGHRVQDAASSVGLGWNLSAGGSITRVVRGLPDDLAHGFCAGSATDTEPDMFYFVLPGRSGKFVLDPAGHPYTIPYNPALLIKPAICGGAGIWEITDENGNLFRFGVNSSSDRESTTAVPVAGGTTTSYISSWHLSEMYSPNKTEKITFTYGNWATTSSISYYFRQLTDPCNNKTVQDFSSTITTSQRLLTSIAAWSTPINGTPVNTGTITFSWASGRLDMSGGKYLTTVVTTNSQNAQISKYSFQYSYFQSGTCTTQDCYRLKLDKIFDLAPDPLYVFNYNTTTNLPSRYSQNFDHWGFYNGNTVYGWIPQVLSTDLSFMIGNCSLPNNTGASREPDATKMLANLITSINLRGGGIKEFQFESHSAGNTGTNVTVGGARIHSITDRDGLGNAITKTYSYVSENNAALSSGYSFHKPVYRYANCAMMPGTTVIGIYSHSYVDLYDLSGSYIGYSRVEETMGNGKTVYYFTNYDAYPDYTDQTGRQTDMAWKRGFPSSIKVFDSQNRILGEQTLNYNFNLSAYSTVYATTYYFSDSWSCSCGFLCSTSGYVNYPMSYNIVSRPITLTSKRVTTYDPSNSTKSLVQISEYEYDPYTFLVTKTTQYDNSRPTQKYISTIKYASSLDYLYTDDCQANYQSCTQGCPIDDDGTCTYGCYTEYSSCQGTQYYLPPADPRSAALYYMYKRHQYGTPVEVVAQYQDASATNVIRSSINTFKAEGPNNSLIDLAETWNLNQVIDVNSYTPSRLNVQTGPFRGDFVFDTNFRKTRTFNSYDQTTGNLLQETNFLGVQTNYTWDATNTQVLSSTTNGGVNARTKTSTVIPMVGISSTADANGVTTKYEYDVYNRLHIVKDGSDNILQMTRYNYQNETPGFKIMPSTTQGYVGDTFNFNVTDIAASTGGSPQLSWNFGDGSTAVYTGSSLNHSYSSTGSYSVTLTGVNPEYGSVVRTQSVTVYDPVSVAVCASGIVNLDLCGVNQPYLNSCDGETPSDYSTTFIANVTNGCPNYTYYWEMQYPNSDTWTPLSSTTSSTIFNGGSVVGTYTFRCTVTDNCGRSSQNSSVVTYYQSTQGCPSGGGIR